MPSTFTGNTGIEKIADGEQTGLWGQTTNLNFDIVDRALNGSVDVALSGTTHTLTTSDGVLSDGQFAVLTFTGSPSGTNTVTIAPNTAQKLYFVTNSTAETVVLSQGSGATVSVPAGRSRIVFTNGAGAGAAVFDITNTLSGTMSQQNSNSVTITGGTINGTVIGGSTPAAISGTTGQFGTSLNVDGTVTADGLTVDGGNLSKIQASSNGRDLIFQSQEQAGVGQSSKIGTTSNHEVRFISNNTERLRITSTGLVGINNTAPDGDLTVGNTSVSGDVSIRIKGNATSRGFLMFGDSGGAQLGDIMYDHSDDHMRFRVNNTERMRIDASGNVGIGTTSPSQRLDVNGTANATNLTRGGSQVYSRDNILGTVSQSGGVPTGAIIERGSNANGEFVKYADGTMLAYRRVDLDSGEFPTASVGDEVKIDTAYATPASFVNVQNIHLTAIAFNSNAGGTARKAMSAWIRDQRVTLLDAPGLFTRHGVLLRLEERQFNAPDSCSLFFSAMGRWF